MMTTDPMLDRIHQRQIALAEKSPAGDPQRFPYDNASTAALAAGGDLAQSVRDHRAAYEQGHTTACDGHLYRGFCH